MNKMIVETIKEKYLVPFSKVKHIILEDGSFIFWREGTGNNIELLHIKTTEKQKGVGRKLFYEMLDVLKHNPPYHSIFGFTRTSNTEAKLFYKALGFDLQTIPGLYKDGKAIMFCQSYITLLWHRDNPE